jgi:serine/threonine-protein kinase SRPK3
MVYAQIYTDDDLLAEFDRIVALKNINNKKEKKKLKKKLKKKMKANRARLSSNVPPTPPQPPNPDLIKAGLTPNFRIKIADLGNGCWVHHHFQPEIQTRQYRSPETILGIKYNETADIWSFACLLFEMLTGEFLFDPRKNDAYSKSTDHLRLMMEVLNRFPKNFSTIGTQSKKFIEQNGTFRKFEMSFYRSIKDILVHQYQADDSQADMLQQFLLPMLEIIPANRCSARLALNHAWLVPRDDESLFKKDKDSDATTVNLDEVNDLDVPLTFKQVVDEEEFDADVSAVSEDTEDQTDDDFVAYCSYEKEVKFFDRNFKNVYVGYADGIDLNHLDNTENSQFVKL